MSKPIAKVVVLATGPTHCLRLPVAGPKNLIPGGSILVYDVADLEAIKKAVPAAQLKIREFPRLLDQVEDEPRQVEKAPRNDTQRDKKGRRGQ